MDPIRAEAANLSTGEHDPALAIVTAGDIAVGEVAELSIPSNDWVSRNRVAKEMGVDNKKIQEFIDEEIITHPEWFDISQNASGATLTRLHPEFVDLVRSRLSEHPHAPEGWLKKSDLESIYEASHDLITKAIEEIKKEDPDVAHLYKSTPGNRLTEHYHPRVREILDQRIPPSSAISDDWLTLNAMRKAIGRDTTTVQAALTRLTEQDPDFVKSNQFTRGRYTYHGPELVSRLEVEIDKRTVLPPEGWEPVSYIYKTLGKSRQWVDTLMESVREEHADWFVLYYDVQARKQAIHCHPDFTSLATERFTAHSPAPEGWRTRGSLAKELGVSDSYLNRIIAVIENEIPDITAKYLDSTGRANIHLSPEAVERIKAQASQYEYAPEGWNTGFGLSKELGMGQKAIEKKLLRLSESCPDGIQLYRAEGGVVRTHYSPELVSLFLAEVGDYEEAPEGWLILDDFREMLGLAGDTTKRLIEKYRDEHPEWVRLYLSNNSKIQLREYFAPELIALVYEEVISNRQDKEHFKQSAQELAISQQHAEEFLDEVSRGETLAAKEFQALLQMFGSERAVDILFQYRPEYQGVSLPFAKRVIGDYLGEFLVIRGDLQLENLEIGLQYLSNPNLREGLREIIKNDCLSSYNQLRRDGLVEDDFEALQNYISELRNKTASFSTPELAEVINEVEEYYKSLFEVIQIPDNVLEELESGRMFPDINQRINILELMGKQKMLIADDMGLGKSASAILAKEALGVEQALVVVPSNVIDVWQNYLSDYKNADGSAIGYFKEGQAPRVLTINNGVGSLEGLNLSEFDYVLISQERLEREGYMSFLDQLDYDMLIVDEVHKLKNIQDGKRADSLVKLAEKIEGDDKYLALLSGTPVPNKVGDIAMILKLLYPEKFEAVANKDLTRQILDGDILDLRSLLVPRMQMKSLAESVKMPGLVEELHPIQMSEQEREFYEIILEQDDLTASQKLRILRQLVLNPDIFELVPNVESSKHAAVGESLRSTFTTKDKVVMFVNGYMDGVIRGKKDIFGALNLPDDVEVHTIHGEVSDSQRLEIQRMLQEETGKKILLAVSGQTADVGVDFSGAEEVYFYNEPWSEYDRRQQLGRVFRPGLKDDIVCHTFYVEGTIEEGIHRYIDYKYHAVEKLLRGIPISELEQEMLKQAEKQNTPNLEVNSGLAESYLSTSAKMLKIFNYVNEIGQEGFVKFGERYWTDYAKYYSEIGSRSYQANTARLSGTVIDGLAKAKGQPAEFVRILDVASGPEMLRRHMPEEYQDQVVSVDINPHHFEEVDEKRRVGSFLNMPVADSTMDYVNLSLALHYTERPRKDQYERIRVFQELNRVLVNGGTAVINLAHNHGLKNTELFTEAAKHLGFEVVEELSGDVGSGNNFRSQMLVLQKVSSCTQDTPQLVQSMGPTLLQGFKFTKTGFQLKDSRKISTRFSLSNGKVLKARLNEVDQAVFNEEQAVLSLMAKLRKTYRSIKAIPSEVIYQSGLSRAKTDRKRENYVLFKSLETGNGAVITR